MLSLYILSKKGWVGKSANVSKNYHHIDIAPMIVERVIGTGSSDGGFGDSNGFKNHCEQLIQNSNYIHNKCIK